MAEYKSIRVISNADHPGVDQSRADGRPSPLTSQSRAAFLAEFMGARASGQVDRVLDVLLGAVDHDDNHPDEPRLIDEIRGIAPRKAAA